MFDWFCCKTQNSRQIFPEGVYSCYIKSEQSNLHKKAPQQILLYNSKRNPSQFSHWAHTKIKSKNIDDIIGYLEQQDINFTDDDFPHSLLNISKDQINDTNIQWRRIKDLVKNPIFIKSRNNLDQKKMQGYQTNCHAFHNALVFIARSHSWKIKQLLSCNYSKRGIYQFKLFKKGIIYNVIVDDYVPTVGKNFIFSGPCDQNQIFPILLEKAIAKLCGGYSQIPQNPIEILQMIHCGAIMREQVTDLTNKKQLKFMIDSYLQKNGLAILRAKQNKNLRKCGIHQDQLYQIINTHQIVCKNGEKQTLVEILTENKMSSWTGKFNAIDPVWQQIPTIQRVKILRNMQKNQSFCMPIGDMSRIFQFMVIFKDTDSFNKQWHQQYSSKNNISSTIFEIKDQDYVFMRVFTHKFIRQSLIVAKIQHKHKYQFIGGSFSQYADFLDFSSNLEPGKYLICAIHQWEQKNQGNYNIYVSSGNRVYLQSYNEPPLDFLEQICSNHQEKLNLQKNQIFYSHIKQIGISYLKVSPSLEIANPLKKITINHKELEQLDWHIIQPYSSLQQILVSSKTIYVIIIAGSYCKQPALRFPLDGLTVYGENLN